MMFLTFLYILSITEVYPKQKWKLILICIPYCIVLLLLFITIPSLKFTQGITTNYSEGLSVFTCDVAIILYFTFTVFTFLHRWKYIERRKRMTIVVYTTVSLCVMICQFLLPESLITAIAPTIFILGIYLNHEEPAIKKLTQVNNDTVIDFATLVENRDNNTGGHINRTTSYVKLLLSAFQEKKLYKDLLTKDYINNLIMAAPLHDIGKISTPDAILQKPGKLTDEEFAIMKEHAQKGAVIIKETFGKRENSDFIQLAYDVAHYHHEKWNGKGYPKGLKEKEIPLSARIMAIADVFDAISQKRCYREAMPLEQCFDIILKGRESDFDPLLVDIFLEIRPKVEKIYKEV